MQAGSNLCAFREAFRCDTVSYSGYSSNSFPHLLVFLNASICGRAFKGQ